MFLFLHYKYYVMYGDAVSLIIFLFCWVQIFAYM